MPCPHYTHTNRQVGDNLSHVCRDCMAVMDCGCMDELGAAPTIDELVAHLDEQAAVAVDEAEILRLMDDGNPHAGDLGGEA